MSPPHASVRAVFLLGLVRGGPHFRLRFRLDICGHGFSVIGDRLCKPVLEDRDRLVVYPNLTFDEFLDGSACVLAEFLVVEPALDHVVQEIQHYVWFRVF